MYNISELLSTLKDDMNIANIVLPDKIQDVDMVERLQSSALKDFSIISPHIEEVLITGDNISDMSPNSYMGYVTYDIPKHYIGNRKIISVLNINPGGYGGSASMYMPTITMGGADQIMEGVADIMLAATLGSQMAHAPTYEFVKPNHVRIYSGWYGGFFVVRVAMTHDINLSTLEEGTYISFKELARLDLEQFLYNRLSRLDSLETGSGTVELNISRWEDSGARKLELLKEWHQNGSTLDSSVITYF